ncbi:hypothetical protein D9V32_13045 [Mycetocola tolaasinivorans]|uniref:Uncharacterized protein n=1 Tax=Mycetocola tolaasinivorans TaxID=76635 RepID=A0A3L7A2A1_9MICO|nr:hypothetical protein [Mycetocola tolaasinivorans]RLP74277.1 hypothetical protein D9V32_13045 [Mycetocola tolaasinivorans]
MPATIGALLAVGPLSGCVGQVGISPVTTATASIDLDAGTVEQPLDRYDGDANAFVAKYRHALALNVDRCVVERGFPALALRVEWAEIGPQERSEFLRWKLDSVAQYGLDPDARDPVPNVPISSSAGEEAASKACSETATGDFTEVFDFLYGLRVDKDVKNRAIAITTLYTLLGGYQGALIAENLSDLEAVVERRDALERDLDQRIAAG